MKADTIIIGGGLTGLTCGIRQARAGRSVIILSSGQSALHFCSGSLELLGCVSGREVKEPIAAIDSLPGGHPYRTLGAGTCSQLADDAAALLADAGVKLRGSKDLNHYRITPIGEVKPAWLTLSDYPELSSAERMPWKSVAILNLKGYLDIYPPFVARAFDTRGVKVRMAEVSIPELDHLRRSPSEMRATNMARILTGETLERLAEAINNEIKTYSNDIDAILMPAVIGLFDDAPVERLRSLVDKELLFLPTLPTSVPGVRMQLMLRECFRKLGGIYLLGDKATSGTVEGNTLVEVMSEKLGRQPLRADNYVLATGSFFSHGLVATPFKIYEPVFGLDVNVPEGGRQAWVNRDFNRPQPFMTAGVAHDGEFHALKDGRPVDNLYVAGASLGGCYPMVESSGGGISMLTALAVAENILIKK